MLTRVSNLFLMVVVTVIFASSSFAGVEMAYDLSPGRVLKYEYKFRQFVGPDLSQLKDSGAFVKFHLQVRFEPEGKVTLEASDLHLEPTEGWSGDFDLKNFSNITCTVTAVMDTSGGLNNISEPKIDIVAREGTPSEIERKGIRLFMWPYLCRSAELALVRLPPVERGLGQSWRCEGHNWGCEFSQSDRLFPFEVLQISDIRENRFVKIVSGPTQDVASLSSEPQPPMGIERVPFRRRQYDLQVDFDLEEKCVVRGEFVKIHEQNSGDPNLPPYPIYMAKQLHEIELLE